MAGKGEEITTRFKVDISDLKKGISEANQQIKLANAQFKAASSGMEDWAKSSDGIKAKLQQLTSILTAQNSKLKSYQDQLQRQQEAYETNGKRADELRAKLQQLASQGVEKTSDEYKQYQKALTEVEKEQLSNQKAIDNLNITILNQQGAINGTQREIDNYNSSLDQMEAEAKEAAVAAKVQKTAYETLQSTIDSQQSKLDALKSKYANVVLAQGKNSNAAKNLAREIDNLSSELQQNKSKLNEADKAADDLDHSLDGLGDSADSSAGGFTILKGALSKLVADGIRLAIDAIKDFAKQTIEVGKQFDLSMSQVAAVSGATGDELEFLRDKAKEMGANTKFSASEAADAFNYMAMAGWKTEDMLSGIEGVLNLAAAANSDLATTSDIVTDALTAMGYSAGDAGRLADVMAAASSNANTNVEMMGGTFKYAAPIIGAMGYSMEDAAVAIGLMANAGIKGEQAGTALRSTLSRLAAPPKECAIAMDALGISITNADGTMKPLNQVIEDMRAAFSGLSESQQTQRAKAIAGTEAMSGLLAIINASPADFDKLTVAVNESEGAAAKMAETMQDNLGGDLTKLGSQFEGIQISLYEKFEPALRAGVEVLRKLGDALQWLIDHSSEVIAVLAGMAAGVAAYLAYTTAITVMTEGWMALTIVQKAVTAAQWLMNAAMNANPIGLVIAAVAALVTAFVILWNKSEGFRNFWIGLWEKIKTAVQPVIDSVKEAFSSLWEKIKVIWEPVKEWFIKIWNGIKESLVPVIDSVIEAFKSAWELIKVVWDLVKPYFEQVWNRIKTIFSVVKTVLSGFFKVAWEAIKFVWDLVVPYFKQVWNTIKEIFSVVKTFLGGMFKTAWEAIKLVWNTVVGYFKAVWDSIANIFSVVKNVLTGNWKDAWQGIKNIVNTWKQYFQGIWDGIKKVFGSVKTWFKDTFSAAWTAVKNVFSGWGKFFGNLWNTIKTKFSSLGTSISNAIGGAVKAGINKVISLIESTINKAIGLINGAIGLINKLPGVNVGKVSKVSLPRLAKGGVLAKGQVGLLEGSGAEAVVPLERNKYWIREVANTLLKELQNTGSLSANAANLASNSNQYNFTQIINAPKQPSRIELYRQTRNLLAYAKGGG